MSFSSSSFSSSSSASPPTKSSSTPPTPTKPRSFSVSSLSQNAYYHLYHSLPSTPRLSLPLHRTSIIDQATSTHSHHQIINIAVKKLIVVFASVHLVISTASLAFALIRKRKASARGESRSLWYVIKAVWSDEKIARLAAFLGSYSALWTLAFPALSKLRKHTQPGAPRSLPLFNKKPLSLPSLLHVSRLWLARFLADWAAALAGAIAGLALLAQTKQERVNLAPNIFCRGLYTLLKYKPIMNLPYSDLILFGLSNAQIMSAFVLHPQTLPSWYWHWIRRVGSLDVKFLELHRLLNHSKVRDMALPKQVLDRTRPRTAGNEQRLRYWLGRPDPLSAPTAPCHFNHPLSDSCLVGNGMRTWGAFKSMLPTYAVLHLVPALFFRSKVFMKSPTSFLISIARKTTSSALFLATFVWIILFSVCIPSRLYESSNGSIKLRGTRWNGVVGFATAFSLLWEDPRRRGELALYCAPKALASIWAVMKAKRLVRSVGYGEMILASTGTAMLMHCFVHAPQSMPALIRGTLGQLIDPHFPGRSSAIKQSKMKEISSADPFSAPAPPPLPNPDNYNHIQTPPPATRSALVVSDKISYFGVLSEEVQILNPHPLPPSSSSTK
ncbi:hypothetical protein PCANC_10293 [Puccinia coronata f. sp. avenae]|uniref:Transmembrane protein 135 N-terminal domain-containing protein n=1 Tax=Puccinia coronata f. sp. avenae TaxID=200324 RepID=A0A2N5SKG2_9BASI|nr:hypothetical protein PCASD_25657 [Puccinia coronata f. sp. avenae]PLW13709.1 hypothetical protein PCANC_21755 [Puccinia coronata f. sp. avenae]PLW38938.1 hypothetical protein PCASD_11692 [Puccinia coronata f. sp. avenae]PLW52172.1 hypothetical protein PCANC_10293 [Puccinia coronata f. sp. avenae]